MWLILIKSAQPVAELPQIAEDVRPGRPLLAICRAEPPPDVWRRRYRQERRLAIPISGDEPEVKTCEGPEDGDVLQSAAALHVDVKWSMNDEQCTAASFLIWKFQMDHGAWAWTIQNHSKFYILNS
ncbi:MAG: hypothetical protein DMG14_26570 [Acidobacteria bacterium]|nr:MAG: hypothetical protein DMG14_26570 [Acidobacteriota bacterium]